MKKRVLIVFCLIITIAISFLSIKTLKDLAVSAVDFNHYHTYLEIEQILSEFEHDYSNLVRLYTIGKTLQGRNLYALEITNRSFGTPESKPAMLFVGPHHGNEIIGAEISLYFAWYLLSNYPMDSRVREIVDTRTIYIIPVVNPDGHYQALTTDFDARFNSRGVDLNRNYGYQWVRTIRHGEYAFSEPETAAVRDFVMSHPNIATGFDTHSGAKLLLYPWGYTLEHSPDFETYDYLARTYSEMTGYEELQASFLYNYTIFGGAEDWMYGNQSIVYFIGEIYPRWTDGGGQLEHSMRKQGEEHSINNQDTQPPTRYWSWWYYNPIESQIESWAKKNLPILLGLAEITPKMEITNVSIKSLEQTTEYATYSIWATIQNTGFLATSTRQSVLISAAKPVTVEFKTDPPAELIEGDADTSLGVLQGYQSVTLDWILKAYSLETTWITVSAISEKGGTDVTSFALP